MIVMVAAAALAIFSLLLLASHGAYAFQTKLSPAEQQGFNKFMQDWKRVCPDKNNMTSFCDGYLTGASITSEGP